jgi:hypothetical protein
MQMHDLLSEQKHFPNRWGYAIGVFDSTIDVFDTIMHSKSPMCIS